MSTPFAQLCGQRAATFTDNEAVEEAFKRLNRWALLSSSRQVALDEVAWIGALLVKSFKASGLEVFKTETRDANGARVVGVVASDGVKVADGAA